jgi:hypothetical protein
MPGQFDISAELIDRLPALRGAAIDRVDGTITVSSVFMVSLALREAVPDPNRGQRLATKLAQGLDRLGKPGNTVRALFECKAFVEDAIDQLPEECPESEYVIFDTVGSWVLKNFLGRIPETREEQEAARYLGVRIARSNAGWWAV